MHLTWAYMLKFRDVKIGIGHIKTTQLIIEMELFNKQG